MAGQAFFSVCTACKPIFNQASYDNCVHFIDLLGCPDNSGTRNHQI